MLPSRWSRRDRGRERPVLGAGAFAASLVLAGCAGGGSHAFEQLLDAAPVTGSWEPSPEVRARLDQALAPDPGRLDDTPTYRGSEGFAFSGSGQGCGSLHVGVGLILERLGVIAPRPVQEKREAAPGMDDSAASEAWTRRRERAVGRESIPVDTGHPDTRPPVRRPSGEARRRGPAGEVSGEAEREAPDGD